MPSSHSKVAGGGVAEAGILSYQRMISSGALYEVDLKRRALKKRVSAERMIKRMWPLAARGLTGEP